MQEKYHREELDLSGLTDFIKHYWKTLETGCSERLKGKWFNTLIFSATPSYTVQTNHLGALVNNLSAVKYRQIEERAVEVARYIVDNNATVRQAAKAFGISKSTIHKDVAERLLKINPGLAEEARKVLDINKQERHLRGGLATKEKYLHKTEK